MGGLGRARRDALPPPASLDSFAVATPGDAPAVPDEGCNPLQSDAIQAPSRSVGVIRCPQMGPSTAILSVPQRPSAAINVPDAPRAPQDEEPEDCTDRDRGEHDNEESRPQTRVTGRWRAWRMRRRRRMAGRLLGACGCSGCGGLGGLPGEGEGGGEGERSPMASVSRGAKKTMPPSTAAPENFWMPTAPAGPTGTLWKLPLAMSKIPTASA